MARNPFKPTFGVNPPLLVAREALIEGFEIGLDDGPGNPNRASIYTGSRGIGKTVLLNALEERARRRGWLVISETAKEGLVTRLAREHLPALLGKYADQGTRTRLTGLGFLGLNATWHTTDRHTVSAGLRTLTEELLDALAVHETGLLITLDELRPGVGELEELLAVVQHMFRSERDIALAGAGLPDAVQRLVSEPGMTFLQRAAREDLLDVPPRDVEQAIEQPITDKGRVITSPALRHAAEATGGYPFMIQLVGYYSWNQNLDMDEITLADVQRGVIQARRRVGSLVHEPALKDCSPVAVSYLLAMSVDDGPSRTSEVAARINASANYGSQYRRHLISAGLITPTAHGLVDFRLPGMREYLREHAAMLSAGT